MNIFKVKLLAISFALESVVKLLSLACVLEKRKTLEGEQRCGMECRCGMGVKV